jgi:hypothetical protein
MKSAKTFLRGDEAETQARSMSHGRYIVVTQQLFAYSSTTYENIL